MANTDIDLKKADAMLTKICRRIPTSMISFETDEEQSLVEYLASRGFVEIKKEPSKIYKYNCTVYITEEGRRIQAEGELIAKYNKDKKDDRRIKMADLRSWIAIVVSIVALLASILIAIFKH